MPLWYQLAYFFFHRHFHLIWENWLQLCSIEEMSHMYYLKYCLFARNLLVIYIPCVPVVICVPVSQFVISLWVSGSSFTFPVSRCPGRHLCPGVPVCNFSLSFSVVIYIPCVPTFSFLFLLYFSVFFPFFSFFFFLSF